MQTIHRKNWFVGFDPKTERARAIWFGTDTGTIGRAVVE
jgi:hypothetical protein